MELLAGDRLGKYEVIGRLAAGGMAEVYLARALGHGGFSKVVALKRMLPELASEPGFRQMFMQEAALAARLHHPNIVQIFDIAEERGELYIAMEYIHGVTLKQLHADSIARGAVDPRMRANPVLIAQICLCIARALAHAWQVPDEQGRPSRLIHRDVSPHNVLLSFEGDAKLADFGIARPADTRTSVGVLKGKLLYMAPEQLLGGDLDARTDVFALGVVLYEAALGMRKPIFDAGTEAAVKQAIQSRLLVPPSRLDPAFPESISAVAMKALERDVRRRFQSAEEFVEALSAAIHREAKSPLDYDISAYMRRLYGEPPPIPAYRPVARAEARPNPPPAESELERRADDPFAPTILRANAEAAAAVHQSGESDAGTTKPDRGDKGGAEHSVVGTASRRGKSTLFVGSLVLAMLAGVMISSISSRWLVSNGVADRAKSGGAADESPPAEPKDNGQTTAGSIVFPNDETNARDGSAPPAEQAGPSLATAPETGGAEAQPSTPAHAADITQVSVPEKPQQKASGRIAEHRVKAEKRRGTLVVHAKPWGFVWVDDEEFTGKREQEASPLLKRNLSVGRHLVHIQEPTGKNRTIPVIIRPEQEVRIEETFLP